jgi:hypothetical protein
MCGVVRCEENIVFNFGGIEKQEEKKVIVI